MPNSRPTFLLLTAVLALAAPACRPEPVGEAESNAAISRPDGVEAISLLGEPLTAPDLPDAVRAAFQENLLVARAAYDLDRADADAIIWLGRRTAYLGRYREAIEIYSRGLVLHPDEARLLRHRGHRWITVREFDRAIEDLKTAVRLIEGTEDRVEPDGLPNAAGIPTTTLHFNVWYHLGLAHYLKGEFEQALLAWQACLDVARHDDARVAATYWLHTTLRRLGLEERARQLRMEVDPATELLENDGYLEVLLLHRGLHTADEVLGTAADVEVDPVAAPTVAYGVAMWHWLEGRREEGYRMMERIVRDRGQWAAFGYVAAEAELARAAG
ncbi:MAG: hypothetical protein RQ751_13790 [Longimicrobiales bacterium]|nr:hypothetical protein [Longimicrobiales bacterium]